MHLVVLWDVGGLAWVQATCRWCVLSPPHVILRGREQQARPRSCMSCDMYLTFIGRAYIPTWMRVIVGSTRMCPCVYGCGWWWLGSHRSVIVVFIKSLQSDVQESSYAAMANLPGFSLDDAIRGPHAIGTVTWHHAGISRCLLLPVISIIECCILHLTVGSRH